MKIKKLKLAFCMLAVGLCLSFAQGKALAGVPSCIFAKSSSSSRVIDPVALKAYYTKRAKEAFPIAKKNGLIPRVRVVAKIEKDVTPAEVLTIPFFETTCGLKKRSGSFVGVMQIAPKTFLEMIARYGLWATEQLEKHDPSSATQLKRVARFITYANGKTILDNKAYKASYPKTTHSLKKTALALRNNDTISMLLAVHDSQEIMDNFRKKPKKPPLIQKLTKRVGGDNFVTRLFHNWGTYGGAKVASCNKPRTPLVTIVGENARTGWGNTTVAQHVEIAALSYSAVSKTFDSLLTSPKEKPQEPTKKAEGPIRSTSYASSQNHKGKGRSSQP